MLGVIGFDRILSFLSVSLDGIFHMEGMFGLRSLRVAWIGVSMVLIVRTGWDRIAWDRVG